MGGYLSSTPSQREEMLRTIGLGSLEELYSCVPQSLMLRDGPDIPTGMSELEVRRAMEETAAKNTVFKTVLRGAGAYRHYIPEIVKTVVSKETFLTAYTPYQAEISQGVLQAIFEYQTMICALTGMEASNASLYDGASAAAEASAMCRDRKRGVTLVSAGAHPHVIETIRTYCRASGNEMALTPLSGGVTDFDALEKLLDGQTACVYIQQPNYYGQLEDCQRAAEIAHRAGAKLIMGVNPIAMALLKTPGECGADIAVGEGQPLGMPLSFGGPYLGFIAATQALTRKLPGRIAGQTVDAEGNRAYVLTLQAREQHIRREKASSNVCSNQALCAMTAAVYLAAMGPGGLKQAAAQSMSKAHYLAGELEKIGFKRKYGGSFFHEFVTECPPGADAERLLSYLEAHSILGGLPVEGGILWCATELNTKKELDDTAALLAEALRKGGGMI